jgi:Protein of unknown function (DUF3176)
MDTTKFPLMEISSTDSPAPSRPAQPSLFQRLKTLKQKGWIFEFSCHSVSVLLFLAVVAILKHVDNTTYRGDILTQPGWFSWPGIITFLATLMKGAMLVGVGSALGQLRWSWYKEHRKLADLETLEGVNSSTLGSLNLLVVFKFRQVNFSLTLR